MERSIDKRLIEEVQRLAVAPLDLEEDLFESEQAVSYETVDPETVEALTNFSSAENDAENQEFAQIMWGLLESLTPRERKLLMLRFGLGGVKEHTLEELATIFDLSRERIRQLEAKALRKLRHPSRSDKLKPYVGWDPVPDPCPNIEYYGKSIEELFRYHDALAAWNIRRQAEKMRLKEIKAQLKKGTLI